MADGAGEVARAREAVVIRPGDTLIVRVDPASTWGDVEELKRAFVERMPNVQVIVVAAEQLAAVRAESGSRWIGQDHG
jgi:hypothetical protein